MRAAARAAEALGAATLELGYGVRSRFSRQLETAALPDRCASDWLTCKY
ncbi:hypothetical protein ANO14919_103440 [Xylariales sp. No.14919]|nr:hypothetical protein ANO14919_103440 [Xylariales sp. No.14919]